MPVPLSTPTRTLAANTMETTPTMLEEWATISVAWSLILGKFTARARPAPIMKTKASGKISATSRIITTAVSSALNQRSLGRRVER